MRISSEQEWFAAEEHGLGFRRIGAVEIHLHQETANKGFENRMSGGLFARENLFDGADLVAGNHIEVAVVNRTAGHSAGLVVVGDESEVQRLAASGVQIIGRLFGGE